MLKVSVSSPERLLFDGEATHVVVPAFDGFLGILEDHAPMMTLLGRGELRLDGAGEQRRFSVSGGFLQVVDNHVRVVTESAEPL